MKSDNDLLHEYLDRRSTPKLLNDLHKDLLDRQREGRLEISLPNVSSVRVEDEDGYLSKLGVSQ